MADNLPPVKPFPPVPNTDDFKHLSQHEKMLQGLPYKPWGEELVAMRTRCRNLIEQYNRAPFEDTKGRRAILDELFHPSCKDKKNIYIESQFRCDYGTNIKVGHNFYANFDCVLLDSGLIEFGNDCMLAPGVHVYAASHPLDSAYRLLDDSKNYYELAPSVKIGNNAWLGGGCIINPGVTLGNNVIVGAGAVVTKSFPDNVVLGGNPAKVIRHMPEPTVPSSPFWKA